METRTTPPVRNRCSCCRQTGHNRLRCPFDAATATSLRDQYNREQRELVRGVRNQLLGRTPEPEWRAEVYAQVVDMQRRLEVLTGNGPPQWPPRNVPTVREMKIQEILFENAEKIPDGLYKELMDALVIRG